MKEWYKDFIGVYENTFDSEWCNNIINIINQSSLQPRHPTEGGNLSKEDLSGFLEDYNLDLASKINKFLVESILSLYSKKYAIFREIGLLEIRDLKLQKTKPTEGYHLWHCENDFNNPTRVGVWTIYLNDINEGGETEFLYQSLRIKPTQGTVVIFPASYTHTHRGNPPLLETKYIMTGWVNYVNPKI